MWDFLLPPALMFGWFALFRWVLPSLGVSTCLSGTCGDSAETQWRAELERIGSENADDPRIHSTEAMNTRRTSPTRDARTTEGSIR